MEGHPLPLHALAVDEAVFPEPLRKLAYVGAAMIHISADWKYLCFRRSDYIHRGLMPDTRAFGSLDGDILVPLDATWVRDAYVDARDMALIVEYLNGLANEEEARAIGVFDGEDQ